MQEQIQVSFKDKQRTIRFGIGPSRILCTNKGINVSEMNSLDVNELIQDMIAASFEFDCHLKSEEVDFTIWEVYQWITELSQEEFQKIFDVYIKTKVVGKSVYDLYVSKLEEISGPVTEEKKS